MPFTVSNLIDQFDAHLVVQLKCDQKSAKTLAWYRTALMKLRAAAGDVPAADLRLHHLVAVAFSNHFVRVLKTLYAWASDDDMELVPRDPFRKVDTPQCGQRNRTFTRPELRRLLRVAPIPLRRVIMIAALTGARPGEMRLLDWGQVCEADRLILLTRFKAKDKRRDNRGVRAIPLSLAAVRILRWLRATSPDAAANAPVFRSKRSRRWSASAIQCALRRARRKAGLEDGGEDVVLYTARHTFATVATRNGMQNRLLQEILGHTNPSTTARYQHLVAADLVDAIDKAAGASDDRTRPANGRVSPRS